MHKSFFTTELFVSIYYTFVSTIQIKIQNIFILPVSCSPPVNHYSIFCYQRLALPIYEYHTHGSYAMYSCGWHLFLNIIFVIVIHIVDYIRSSFLFVYLSV